MKRRQRREAPTRAEIAAEGAAMRAEAAATRMELLALRADIANTVVLLGEFGDQLKEAG